MSGSYSEQEAQEIIRRAAAVQNTGYMSRDELMTLGKELRAAKKVAPTRPHPNAPDSPPANMIVGGAAAVVDRARDAVSGRGKARAPKKKATARTRRSTSGSTMRSPSAR